ncbi:MAG: PilZ domain-containing protein [Nitrospirae bacterium]|nr:PilZ domain-containing protein [Nitrospirota bacterium]
MLLARKKKIISPQEQSREERRGARFAVNLTGICYRTADALDQRRTAGREVEVKDMSSRGACIETPFPLKRSEVLKIAFPIQNPIFNYISTPPTLAEVRWTYPVTKNKYLSGFRFLL